ncbi:hypothetical protein BCR37DRAFT_390658 [Protomyces lactucae-debilis]|uniref:non-specific serine/threonine protein kinase n=1 Tax=Protomyces lactucae-debilis TaxID=2754530 RepID=A0A1Y2FUG5_PROLT|nr:uncharacterized protein BCR37DRAFT_390658 [Protomyces lactucae-debilis]ORY86934.1 hypothetical protein BCR37DRAFT_390658 [Protomyces lactucae-debilis]
MSQRPKPLPVQADKRISQVSQISEFSINSTGSDARRHKAHIGPWRLGRTLGRGSSGRVRLAKHAVTGKLAAVKIVPKLSASTVRKDDQGRPRDKVGGLPYGIDREVVIMKLIEHPNIMRLYDVWENKAELYLVLEYIEGGELFEYLVQRGRLPEEEAVDFITQILNAVDYCHRFNICHRDLKPENLLLDGNRNIKVADFGMAALEPMGQKLQTSCGSPHYASPEIISGNHYNGAPCDIWSCGIILFALLTGQLPFDDEVVMNLLAKVRSGQYTMPTFLSPLAQNLISRMLEVDPHKRITMPEILNHPLLAMYRKSGGPKLPKPLAMEMVGRPVRTAGEVDWEILKNLQTLWRGAPKELIIQKLLRPEANAEKTFYCLLEKYRHDRLENYSGDEDYKPVTKMVKSASRRSLASRKSGTSARRAKHRKNASRGSKASSHRRGVSFGRPTKTDVQSQPSAPMPKTTAAPQESINFALPRVSPPKRRAPSNITQAQRRLDEETARKISAEFGQLMDAAFNTAGPVSPTVTVLPDGTSLDRALPSPPYDVFAGKSEPPLGRTDSHKQRAHKSSEAASIFLPRIFEEDRYADAEEARALDLGLILGDQPKRPKAVKGYSYPTRPSGPRAALGELDAAQTNNTAAAAARSAALSVYPNGKRRELTIEDKTGRVSSLVEKTTTTKQSAARRFVSAPTYTRMPSELAKTFRLGRVLGEDSNTNTEQVEPAKGNSQMRNWFGRKFSMLKADRPAPRAPKQDEVSPAVAPAISSTPAAYQSSPPGHPTAHGSPVNLAARRHAPSPPRLQNLERRGTSGRESRSQDVPQQQKHVADLHKAAPQQTIHSPDFPKQSFFARLLNIKPASKTLDTTLSAAKLQREVVDCLRRWEQANLGIQGIQEDRRQGFVRSRLGAKNALKLRPVCFRIECQSHSAGASAVFVQEKGARSTFNRVVQEFESIWKQAGKLQNFASKDVQRPHSAAAVLRPASQQALQRPPSVAPALRPASAAAGQRPSSRISAYAL